MEIETESQQAWDEFCLEWDEYEEERQNENHN